MLEFTVFSPLYVLIVAIVLFNSCHVVFSGCVNRVTERLFHSCEILSPQKRVSSEKCVELTIIAATHGLKEAWISYQVKALIRNVLLFQYVAIFKHLFSAFCTMKSP